MRLSELLSVASVNVCLALFSMVAAIAALALLAFVLAKDNISPEKSFSHAKEKMRRHESVVVDFRRPETVPSHFLEFNTLMFDKNRRAKNNQITEIPVPLNLPGLERMVSPQEDDSAPPPPPIEKDFDMSIYANQIASVNQAEGEMKEKMIRQMWRHSENGVERRARRSTELRTLPEAESEETESETLSQSSVSTTEEVESSGAEPDQDMTASPSPEVDTIEPPAEKLLVNLDCGNEFSLC